MRFWSLKHATALDNNLLLQVTNYISGVNEKTDFNTVKNEAKNKLDSQITKLRSGLKIQPKTIHNECHLTLLLSGK